MKKKEGPERPQKQPEAEGEDLEKKGREEKWE